MCTHTCAREMGQAWGQGLVIEGGLRQPKLGSAKCLDEGDLGFFCFSSYSRERRVALLLGPGLSGRDGLAGPGWGLPVLTQSHKALCGRSMPSLSVSLPSVASTPTAAASAGRPPSRASASESWGPGNHLPTPSAHIFPEQA